MVNGMGGNALSFETKRLDKAAYQKLVGKVMNALFQKFHSVGDVKALPIAAYFEKDSFGDLDIIWTSNGYDITEHIQELYSPKEIVRNGSVVSFDFEDFQVDFIHSAEEDYWFGYNYFSWNDLGNFIGRTAHRLGFKFGHDGLKYVLRDSDNPVRVVAELSVTKNFDEALEFLGFSYSKFAGGFKNPTEIYEFAASSEYFDPASFAFANRNHTSRVRDKKRKMYNGAVAYFTEKFGLTEDAVQISVNKDLHFNRALHKFPEFKEKYFAALELHKKDKAFKVNFNGENVGLALCLSGKELGAKMKVLKEHLTEYNLKEWTSTLSSVAFRRLVLLLEQDNKLKTE